MRGFQQPARPRAGYVAASIAAFLLVIFSATASAAPDLEQALRLLGSGAADQAYEMLAAKEAEHAGDPNFDYLLGLAALDSGRPSRAVFALERVLAVDPGHARARRNSARLFPTR